MFKQLVLATCIFVGTSFPAYASTSELNRIYQFVKTHDGEVAAKKYSKLIYNKAHKYEIPSLILASVIHTESGADANCVTGRCVGLMQINPVYWAKQNENMFNPADNVEAGSRLLSYLYKRFGSWPQALTAYNFGENHRVTRSVGTSRYAKKIIKEAFKK